jgi:hypothetical protein
MLNMLDFIFVASFRRFRQTQKQASSAIDVRFIGS